MKKSALLFLTIIAFCLQTYAQDFKWVNTMGSTTNDAGETIAQDSDGNIYVGGYFRAVIDFDTSPDSMYLASSGGIDCFIQKLTPEGSLLWAKRMGGIDADDCKSIAIDSSGNVYSTGYFMDTVDFDPGIDSLKLRTRGNQDIFVQKLDTNGELLWAKSIGGSGLDRGQKLAVDAAGAVYITGDFERTVDFDSGQDTVELTANENADIFILKLSTDGDFVWVRSIGASQGGSSGATTGARGITLDGNANVYTTGFFDQGSLEDSVDFDPGPGVFNMASAHWHDIFIQKMDSSGNFVWAKRMGGTSVDAPTDIAVDANGNVYTSGNFQSNADFDPGAGDSIVIANGTSLYLHKLDSLGNFAWVRTLGGINTENGIALSLDNHGNIYTTGYFGSTMDFDPGPGLVRIAPMGNRDIFIQKWDANADFVWVKTIGSPGPRMNNRGVDIVVDDYENIYVTGRFVGTADFDPGVGKHKITSNGSGDIFVLRLSPQCSVDTTLSINDPNITANTSGASYQWLDCDNNHSAITGATTQAFTATTNGNYAVEITENGCVDTSACANISRIGLAIEGDILLSQLSIYPNPASQSITLRYTLTHSQHISILLYDSQGRLVQTLLADQQLAAGSQNHDFQLAPSLSAGLYQLILRSEAGRSAVKISKW